VPCCFQLTSVLRAKATVQHGNIDTVSSLPSLAKTPLKRRCTCHLGLRHRITNQVVFIFPYSEDQEDELH
jgi:hypothetical protein